MKTLITFQFGVLLLLSWILFCKGFVNLPSMANVTPNDPILEVGDTLVLNCTLTHLYNGTHNASDLYFYNGINYSYPYVQVLSNITAQFRLPNITINMLGYYICKIRGGEYLGHGAGQSLNVFRRPLQPVLDGCIISNWEQMECSWSPSRAKQDNYTHASKSLVQTLLHRHPGDDDNWKTCPQNETENKCIWPAPQFKMGANYCIQINATNVLNHTVTSNVTCVLAQDEIVKPNPPENVESSFTSDYDGYVTLHWSPPTSTYKYKVPLLYELDIQNQWQDKMSNVTTETSMRLSVVSSTSYTVQISVRPSSLGFASEKVTHRFETPPTVPCQNPLTQTNAFYMAEGSQSILFYWQPIAERDYCGSSLMYEVRARKSDGDDMWRIVRSLGSLGNSAEVMLNKDEDEVTIQSKNSVGLATHLPHVIFHVPSSSSGENSSLNYRLVAEGNANNTVMVHWFATAPLGNVTGFTLFWCQQHSITRICKTPIQWKNLNGAEFEYNLTLSENYLKFQVGLAVNFLSGSASGIMWDDKLYSQTAEAEAPRIKETVVPYLRFYGEIDLSWTPAPCFERCAYIHTFIISYCLADHQNMCHGEIKSVSVESWKGFTYRLVNLDHGSKYRIWMTSVSRTGYSKPSEPAFATTTKSWVTAGAIIGIIIAIVCGVTIVIGGLCIILRYLNRYRKTFVKGLPVALPPTHRAQIPSTSSEAPMLGMKCDYNRQESVSSGDSGRYSLSPASPATLPLLSKLTDANENLNSFIPGNFNALEDMKSEGDDDDSTRGCVLSYTLVSNDPPMVHNGGPKSDINGSVKKGDVTNPGVLTNGGVTGHPKYILPEQIELLGMSPLHPESDVNYCTSFSFARPSENSAADIGYTKVENLQPLYDLVDRLPTVDVINERSQDSCMLPMESSQVNAPVEQTDLVNTIDQLLATLNSDPPLINDFRMDDPATSSENGETELPQLPPPSKPGDDDSPFRDYMKIANTDFPSLACDDVAWMPGNTDFPQQSALSNWGYVDHAMFGVDSAA